MFFSRVVFVCVIADRSLTSAVLNNVQCSSGTVALHAVRQGPDIALLSGESCTLCQIHNGSPNLCSQTMLAD